MGLWISSSWQFEEPLKRQQIEARPSLSLACIFWPFLFSRSPSACSARLAFSTRLAFSFYRRLPSPPCITFELFTMADQKILFFSLFILMIWCVLMHRWGKRNNHLIQSDTVGICLFLYSMAASYRHHGYASRPCEIWPKPRLKHFMKPGFRFGNIV